MYSCTARTRSCGVLSDARLQVRTKSRPVPHPPADLQPLGARPGRLRQLRPRQPGAGRVDSEERHGGLPGQRPARAAVRQLPQASGLSHRHRSLDPSHRVASVHPWRPSSSRRFVRKDYTAASAQLLRAAKIPSGLSTRYMTFVVDRDNKAIVQSKNLGSGERSEAGCMRCTRWGVMGRVRVSASRCGVPCK